MPSPLASKHGPKAKYAIDRFDLINSTNPDRPQAGIGDELLQHFPTVALGPAIKEISLHAANNWVGKDVPTQAVERSI